jgi:hypothetical protein
MTLAQVEQAGRGIAAAKAIYMGVAVAVALVQPVQMAQSIQTRPQLEMVARD